MNPGRLRILLLAARSNPNLLTGPLIGYSLGEALSRLHEVTLVIEARHEKAVREANAGFHSIEPFEVAWLDQVYTWLFRRIFKEDRGNLLWTAINYPRPVAFECLVWRRLRTRILEGEFDIVLRILPIVPMMASPFAFFLRKGPIPFVIGPLNGGLPWPRGFNQLARQRAEAGNWVANLRSLYRFLPFARSTYAEATAIIAGSSNTCREFAHYQDKVFYVPGENGLNSSWIQERRPVSGCDSKQKLELIILNRLVPLKAVDLALRASASLLREGRARLSILGEGPERQRLEDLVDELGVRHAVTFCGWVDHPEVLSRLRESDVLLFPSLREFGGAVVFEALAAGTVPVVADFGGPGDIVTDDVGYRIPLTDERRMAAEIESVLKHLASDRNHLEKLRRQGPVYAREHLTWEAKARMVSDVLLWSVGAGPKPTMPPPKPIED